jgi:hypothetical protein
MLSGSTVPVQIKLFVLLVLASAFFGCALTPNVDNRKPGRPWSYYGDLASVYRDQTGGTKVELVWLDQVLFTRVTQKEFPKAVQNFLKQGYRKIGFISVRSQYFVDPYDIKKLASDKGARMVVGCWFTGRGTKSGTRIVDYWYQLLDKSSTVPASASQAPILSPTTPTRPNDPLNQSFPSRSFGY